MLATRGAKDNSEVINEGLHDRWAADAEAAGFAAEAWLSPALWRRDGRSVYEAHGAPRYSTMATLATEQHVLDIVVAGRDAGRGVANASATEAAILDSGLGEDQAAAVRLVVGGGRGLPRAVNNLALRSLVAAYAQGKAIR